MLAPAPIRWADPATGPRKGLPPRIDQIRTLPVKVPDGRCPSKTAIIRFEVQYASLEG